MKEKKFAVLYKTDDRMNYAEEYLKTHGYEICEDVSQADYVLLPVPAKKHMFEGLDDKTVFYGMGDFEGYDYNKNETFLLKNAYLTAEGAIALFKESADFSLYGSKALITGCGRIAKALHKALSALGCDVTICSRSSKSEAWAIHNCAKHIYFKDLKKENDYDIVFNTVPHIIFTKDEINALKKDVVLIDLASFPGGIDTLYASSKNIKIIDGRKLPSRYSKKSAGYLIGETITQMIKEELT